jgi:glutathione S-transferase
MRLHTALRAPNPRRVHMFLAEKGLTIETVPVRLDGQGNRAADFLARNPFGRVPVLELDDGRCLSETRAICTWFEGHHPEPNLMGVDADERAFIEMHDRRAEFYFLLPIANWIRHGHPGLAPLEQPQFPDFSASQGEKFRALAAQFDAELATRPYWAGERFTIADITAYCAIEFARGLMKFSAAGEGLAHLQAWRDRIHARPSASAGM